MTDKKIYVTQSSMPPYEEYIEAIKPLWESRWLTNMGKYHQQLEEKLKEFLDVPKVSLMVNGHLALELVLHAMEFPEGAEIITTPFTFISTTHAIVRNGLKPVFCDVKPNDGTIDETKIEALITDKTAAILPVHVYGNVCNVEEIQRIAKQHELKVIYDAAHAFGVKYHGKGIGNYGDASIFSFHATKVFHTIEGGAVTFSEQEMYDKLYNLKNFGIRGEERVADIGANAKMNEFAAIMGLCNLKYVAQAMEARRSCWERYAKGLSEVKGIRLLQQRADATQNYGYFPIVVEDAYPINRDELYERLKEDGVYTRKYFYPLTSEAECFGGRYQEAKVDCAREIAGRILTLPMYEELELEKVEQILDVIEKIANR